MDIDKQVDNLAKMGDTNSMVTEAPTKEPTVETAEETITGMVPPNEELITFTADEIEKLKASIVEETTTKIMESPDFRERLRLQLEQSSAMRSIDIRDRVADPALIVMQSGPLGPIDHQEAAVAPFKTDKSMKYRVINHRDETLNAVRRYQGWEPVRDKDGHEVRFMDGTLASMKIAKYDETIGAQTRAKKMLRRQSAELETERFKETAQSKGFETFGEGLKIDVGSPEQAVRE